VVAWAGARLAGRQTSPAPSTDHQSYTSATTAILVDVVVRDHKGQLVTDLTADDFSLTEDGASQKIETFSRVTRGGGIGLNVRWKGAGKTSIVTAKGEDPETSGSAGPAEGGATALVYDHLSEDALHLAQRATLNYIPMNGESKVWLAVFATQPSVSVVQPFTTDRAAVRHAVEQLMTAGTSSTELSAERRDQVGQRIGEIFVFAAAKTVAAHHDLAAEILVARIERGQRGAFVR
jgi:VWFA-related protein